MIAVTTLRLEYRPCVKVAGAHPARRASQQDALLPRNSFQALRVLEWVIFEHESELQALLTGIV